MHLDYSRVEVAVDARRRPMKLWSSTAIGPQQGRCSEIGSPKGEKMPTICSLERAAENKSSGGSKGVCPLGRRAFAFIPPEKGRQGARSEIKLPLEGGMRSGSPSKVDLE